ncbi:hypothetical protein KKG90_03150 [Candidatus Bipolaricaulota bacterium]|nr:hypothetical protein [Candidatus Bipolaricaulota bacterium]
MNAKQKARPNLEGTKLATGTKLSLLWIVVMFNMAFADIFTFMIELTSGVTTSEVQVPQVSMLLFAILVEVPIVMIFLSRVLKARANQWTNTIAAIMTTAFIIAGAAYSLPYAFFAAMEIVAMSFIVWTVWKLPKTA